MTFHHLPRKSSLAVGGITTAMALAACGAMSDPIETAAGSAKPSGVGVTRGSSQQIGATATASSPDSPTHDEPTVIASYDPGNRKFTVVGHPSEQGYCVDVRAGNPGRHRCDPVPTGPPELQLREFERAGEEGYLVGIVDNPDIADVDLIANDGSAIVEGAERFELINVLDGRARAFAPVRGPIYYEAVVAKDAAGNTIARQPVGDDAGSGNYTTGDKSGAGSAVPADPAQLTDVTLSRGEGVASVRLEFAQAGTPAYEIGYQPEPLHYEGSGKPAELEGGRALVIDLTNAADGDTAAGDVLLDPERQSVIAEAKSLGAFEGHVKLGLGSVGDDKIPFRVSAEGNTIVVQFDYGPPESG